MGKKKLELTAEKGVEHAYNHLGYLLRIFYLVFWSTILFDKRREKNLSPYS